MTGEVDRPVSDERDASVAATGKSAGEAKWSAVRELRSRYPGLEDADVTFGAEESSPDGLEVTVRASVDLDRWQDHAEVFKLDEDPVERIRNALTRVVDHLGLPATVSIEEDEDEVVAGINGDDLGVLIGRKGRTLDALQVVMGTIARRDGTWRKRVKVDVAGYRERRLAVLTRTADTAAEQALARQGSVELEPMTAQERKSIHTLLAERADVTTHSEGDEPYRRVVVSALGS